MHRPPELRLVWALPSATRADSHKNAALGLSGLFCTMMHAQPPSNVIGKWSGTLGILINEGEKGPDMFHEFNGCTSYL